jgi:hypothetical protein
MCVYGGGGEGGRREGGMATIEQRSEEERRRTKGARSHLHPRARRLMGRDNANAVGERVRVGQVFNPQRVEWVLAV